jgi:hypothetical protein
MARHKDRRFEVDMESFDVYSSCFKALNVTYEEIENFTESNELPGN